MHEAVEVRCGGSCGGPEAWLADRAFRVKASWARRMNGSMCVRPWSAAMCGNELKCNAGSAQHLPVAPRSRCPLAPFSMPKAPPILRAPWTGWWVYAVRGLAVS